MDNQKDTVVELDVIGQIAVPVTDIDRAVAFYRDILGMKFLFQAPPGLGFFDCNGVRLMLDAPAKANDKDAKASTVYFKVDDLKAAFEKLTDLGVKFIEAPNLGAHMLDHDLWMAFFNDPDGNVMALMSEVRK